VKAGDKVGILGMGGLGHMGIKFAKAMGAEVTLFTRSASKAEEGRRQGADHVIVPPTPRKCTRRGTSTSCWTPSRCSTT